MRCRWSPAPGRATRRHARRPHGSRGGAGCDTPSAARPLVVGPQPVGGIGDRLEVVEGVSPLRDGQEERRPIAAQRAHVAQPPDRVGDALDHVVGDDEVGLQADRLAHRSVAQHEVDRDDLGRGMRGVVRMPTPRPLLREVVGEVDLPLPLEEGRIVEGAELEDAGLPDRQVLHQEGPARLRHAGDVERPAVGDRSHGRLLPSHLLGVAPRAPGDPAAVVHDSRGILA